MYLNNRPIAILLAAYNAEKFICEQIDSILAQTIQNWTLYIRNDGSIDSTGNIIAKYCNLYSEKIIEVDANSHNLGCNGNFFRLLESVKSDYYMFCDADDVWLPNKIEFSYNAIKEKELLHPNFPILIHSDASICDKDLNIIYHSFWESFKIKPEKLSSYNYIAVCCIVGGAKSIFNWNARECMFPLPSNKKIMFDHWLAMNVAKSGLIFALHKPLILYRQHEGQTCGTKKNTIRQQLTNIFKKYKSDAELLNSVGYGSKIKYYKYKLLSILIMRFHY